MTDLRFSCCACSSSFELLQECFTFLHSSERIQSWHQSDALQWILLHLTACLTFAIRRESIRKRFSLIIATYMGARRTPWISKDFSKRPKSLLVIIGCGRLEESVWIDRRCRQNSLLANQRSSLTWSQPWAEISYSMYHRANRVSWRQIPSRW